MSRNGKNGEKKAVDCVVTVSLSKGKINRSELCKIFGFKG